MEALSVEPGAVVRIAKGMVQFTWSVFNGNPKMPPAALAPCFTRATTLVPPYMWQALTRREVLKCLQGKKGPLAHRPEAARSSVDTKTIAHVIERRVGNTPGDQSR